MSQPSFDQPTAAEYIAMFGDVGARWCVEGKPFAACVVEFIAAQNAEIADLERRCAELTALRDAMRFDLPGRRAP